VTGHTPDLPKYLIILGDRPGRIYPTDDGDTFGERVATFLDHGYHPAIAAEIVRRWNAHDDLLAACEALVGAEDERSACDSPEVAANVYRKIEAARAAVAKARGE
jgi:hypothetical protein